tara:strand:+ start:9 stop:740 length:732 start_codon:yes stop_codon:yes gene_type:complete
MSLLFKVIDFFYQKKKYEFLRKKLPKKLDIFFDVGAHYGETINEFLKYFIIKKVYSFEPSKNNFDKLKKNIDKLKKKYPLTEINIKHCGIGKKNEVLSLNEITDGESNTFNSLNVNSNYFKKKKLITTIFGIKNFFKSKIPTNIISLKDYIDKNEIMEIDFIKIDTEGYEYNVLLGIGTNIGKINYILFEHHYDNMIIKNYKFHDIHKLLVDNGFNKIYKTKMPFRKSFDYIYENKKNYLDRF